ncbi:MAG: hypothetical protein WAM42_24400 [Candidatus Nitrosopolaris sp.]
MGTERSIQQGSGTPPMDETFSKKLPLQRFTGSERTGQKNAA